MIGCLAGAAVCLAALYLGARLLHLRVDRHASHVARGRAVPLPDLRDRERVR